MIFLIERGVYIQSIELVPLCTYELIEVWVYVGILINQWVNQLTRILGFESCHKSQGFLPPSTLTVIPRPSHVGGR